MINWPRRALWTMARRPGALGGLPLLPVASRRLGREELPDAPGPCWAWTAPDGLAGPEARPGRCSADVELRSWGKRGAEAREVEAAERLAALCPAVTSHGMAVTRLAHALRQFARAGRIGHPQVYDSDQSSEPVPFLHACLRQWERLGFEHVVPLLGLPAGPERVEAWIGECERLGLDWHLWSARLWSPEWEALVGARLRVEPARRDYDGPTAPIDDA